MENNIQNGLYSLALYENREVEFSYPDIKKNNEISAISYKGLSFLVGYFDNPKLETTFLRNRNNKHAKEYTVSFDVESEEALKLLRNNRVGFIVEIIFLCSNDYSTILKVPLYFDNEIKHPEIYTKRRVELKTRQATTEPELTKINNLLLITSFIIVSENSILGFSTGELVTSK